MVLSISGASYHLIFLHECLHFTDEETEAQSYTMVNFCVTLEYSKV